MLDSSHHYQSLPQPNPILPNIIDFAPPNYEFPSQIDQLPSFLPHSKPPKQILNFDCCDIDYYAKESTPYKTLLELHSSAQIVYQRFQNSNSKSKYFATYKEPKEQTIQRGTIQFNANFECGNLLSAYKIADKKFNLVLHNDTKSKGYTQWYCFSARSSERFMAQINIINLSKPYQYLSIMPYIYSHRTGWHQGGENVQLYKNQYISDSNYIKRYYTLSFSHMFEKDEVFYFAPFVPYGISNLNAFLKPLLIERNLLKIKQIQVANNSAPVLSIGTSSQPLIIIIARQHPSEVVTSFVMEGIIHFLLSPEAAYLREMYYFKVMSMMNPDGVIHGNSRCNLLGIDISKKWHKVNKQVPTIQHVKALIKKADQNLFLVLDLHQSFKKLGVTFGGVELGETLSRFINTFRQISEQANLEIKHFTKSQKYSKRLPQAINEQFKFNQILQIYIGQQYYNDNKSSVNNNSDSLKQIGYQICQTLSQMNQYELNDFQDDLTQNLNDLSLSMSDASCDQIIDEEKKKKKKKQRMQTSIENTHNATFQQTISHKKPPIIPNKKLSCLKPLQEIPQVQLIRQAKPILKCRARSYSTKTPEWNVRQPR